MGKREDIWKLDKFSLDLKMCLWLRYHEDQDSYFSAIVEGLPDEKKNEISKNIDRLTDLCLIDAIWRRDSSNCWSYNYFLEDMTRDLTDGIIKSLGYEIPVHIERVIPQ